MNKDLIKYKELYDRLIAYFDEKNFLSYYGVDVQYLNNKKNFFQAVTLKFKNKIQSQENEDQDIVLYVCTQDADFGVSTREELPKKWLEKFIEVINKIDVNFIYPDIIMNLRCSSIEELELKMGILGI